jgi:MFS family permease
MCEAFVQGAIFCTSPNFYQPIWFDYLYLLPKDLSFWYKYSELATRGAIVFSMSTFAGAFNGLITYGIVQRLDGANGWRAWRWIFLIEGLIPCAFGFLVLFLLPDKPNNIRFGFTATEMRKIVQRSTQAHNATEARLHIKTIPLVLLSVNFWLFCIIACGGHFCIGSLSNFIPSIIQVRNPVRQLSR